MATHVLTNPSNLSIHPSPAPSTNNSPESPRANANHPLPLQNRQLRPSKGPLYVPAALRPTDFSSKSSPPTPPRSVPGSLDAPPDPGEESISRRSTMESDTSGITKTAEDEWMKHEHLGEVTGVPTRDHWKADGASSNCDSPTCRSSFGLFLRRHHCRHCGHVFCSSHTPHAVRLDQDARFHPEGIPSRACDLCWSAYQRWQESRCSQLNMIQSSLDSQTDGDQTASMNSDSSQDSADAVPAPVVDQGAEMAASVPRGWNWSTF